MASEKTDDLSFQTGIISRMMHLYGCATDADLAGRLGVQKGAVSNYRNGRRKIPITLLYKVAFDTDSTLDWLMAGKSPEPAPVLTIQETDRYRTFGNEAAFSNYLPVRLLRDSISAGTPAEVRDGDIEGFCLIYADKSWMPGTPEHYTCCRVRGDSMYPILTNGDIVAIDHSQKDPNRLDQKLVAFRNGEGATIKWLSHVRKDRVLGIPENKSEMESTICLVGEEIETGIIGRVTWWWAKR